MSRGIAVALVLVGATLMSFVGLVLRHIEQADGFQIMAYRSLSLALIVLLFACWRRKQGFTDFLTTIDRKDCLVGLFLGAAFTCYVFALINTNIASALFILACAPIFAAILAWILLGEVPEKLAILAIVLAIFGVTIMVRDGIGSGSSFGNMFAVVSAFCFAVMLVLIRKFDRDPLGGTFMAGVFSSAGNAIIAVLIGSGLAISMWDLGLSLFMGAFTIGLGIACVTVAASFLPPSEVSILVLLESVLGPVWVWLFLGETTTANVLIGGAVVLGAVVLQTLGGTNARVKV
ncbi:MAG: DMT family transporter [Rhizobiaceae bacterium]|nr:DMT family transporter [Rhizobiaceae bacterium]